MFSLCPLLARALNFRNFFKFKNAATSRFSFSLFFIFITPKFLSYFFGPIFLVPSSFIMSFESFREKVRKERENLNKLADFWSCLIGNEHVPEDLNGRILSAVGKTRLLISEKFKQFEGLIDQSEAKSTEKEISINDLQGYWDVVLIQVNEVKEIYKMLDSLHDKSWTERGKNRKTSLIG